MSDAVSVRAVSYRDIESLRTRHRAEADCQIVRDSILPRGLARPFCMEVDGRTAGYAGVWTEYFPGRIMEFFLLPAFREERAAIFSALVATSGATGIEAQTNLPQIHGLLERYGTDITVEKILFAEGADSGLPMLPGVDLSRRAALPAPSDSVDGDWLLVRGGRVVAGGGYLTHYNPPYCDLYMEVVPGERRRGLGSFLIQELRRIARGQGLVPAARCDPDNEASRRTLLRGGFVERGRILTGGLTGV